MNCKYPKKFDSPAEKAMFPMLNTIAISKKLQDIIRLKRNVTNFGNAIR